MTERKREGFFIFLFSFCKNARSVGIQKVKAKKKVKDTHEKKEKKRGQGAIIIGHELVWFELSSIELCRCKNEGRMV